LRIITHHFKAAGDVASFDAMLLGQSGKVILDGRADGTSRGWLSTTSQGRNQGPALAQVLDRF